MKTIAHIAITLMVGVLLGCSAPSATMSPGDRPDRGDRELRRGIYWYHQGCLRKATDHLRAAYEYYCLGDRQSGVARSLIGLANLHRQTGDPQQAMPYYDAAIITARRAAAIYSPPDMRPSAREGGVRRGEETWASRIRVFRASASSGRSWATSTSAPSSRHFSRSRMNALNSLGP